jgi:hypothetical protein
MLQRPCPNDAMRIPVVAEALTGSEPVRFFWCWSCIELFAFVGDPGVLAVGFAADRPGGWRVFRAVGTERDVQLALGAVSQLSPQK